jgi:RNA-directed DNA polymerase
MPEEAPGNPGAGSGDPGESMVLLGKVRGMQARLHRWAGEDPSRRFGDLFNLVYDPDFLAEAWIRVAGNKGARTPGIDGVTVTTVQNRAGGVGRFLDQLAGSLKSGEYRPAEVRQVLIPKKSGKMRKLGIPTVTDRVVQASVKLVLEPVFEADFQPCSYGFRPNRRTHDAIAEIQHFATRGYEWVLEADIRACFDQIDHVALMDRFRARIKDKRVCALVKAFLKSGVMTTLGEREESSAGTPQGGILSPLLANIALSALDDHFARQWQELMGTHSKRRYRRKHGLGRWRLIRYADDFVVVISGERRHAEALRQEVAAVLAPLGLKLAAEKTRVVHIDEGFDFLSTHIRKMRKRGTSERYVYTRPSRAAVQAARDTISEKTYRSTQHQEPGELITSLNRFLAGWANYHRYGVSSAAFSAVDHHAWGRIMRWLRRKYTHRRSQIGMPELRRRFCVPGTWKFACNGAVYKGASSVRTERYRYRGSKIPTPFTPAPATAPQRLTQRPRHVESPVR